MILLKEIVYIQYPPSLEDVSSCRDQEFVTACGVWAFGDDKRKNDET